MLIFLNGVYVQSNTCSRHKNKWSCLPLKIGHQIIALEQIQCKLGHKWFCY